MKPTSARFCAAFVMGCLACCNILAAIAVIAEYNNPWAVTAFDAVKEARVALIAGIGIVAAHIVISRLYDKYDRRALAQAAGVKVSKWPGHIYVLATVIFAIYSAKTVG